MDDLINFFIVSKEDAVNQYQNAIEMTQIICKYLMEIIEKEETC